MDLGHSEDIMVFCSLPHPGARARVVGVVGGAKALCHQGCLLGSRKSLLMSCLSFSCCSNRSLVFWVGNEPFYPVEELPWTSARETGCQ